MGEIISFQEARRRALEVMADSDERVNEERRREFEEMRCQDCVEHEAELTRLRAENAALTARVGELRRLPPVPEDPRKLPAWHDDEPADRLSHSKIARLVGELGLACMQASNAADGRPGDWPIGEWNGLAESSRWSCVRVGLRALETVRTTLAADDAGEGGRC